MLCYSYLLKNIICDYEENYSLFSLYSLTFPHFSDFQIMGEFSSSDDELENLERRNRRLLSDPSPLRMDFINLYRLGIAVNRLLFYTFIQKSLGWAREIPSGSLGFIKSSDWSDARTLMLHHIIYTPIYS